MKDVTMVGSMKTGDICNTNIWPEQPNPEVEKEVEAMFQEQVQWAKEAGVDYIVGETFDFVAEARLACQVIKRAGLPAVITMALVSASRSSMLSKTK